MHRADAAGVGDEHRMRQRLEIADPVRAGHLAVAVQGVGGGEDRRVPDVLPRQHGGHPGAHRALADLQRTVAADDGGMADQHPVDVGDGVGGAGRQGADDDAEIPRPHPAGLRIKAGRGERRKTEDGGRRGRPPSAVGREGAEDIRASYRARRPYNDVMKVSVLVPAYNEAGRPRPRRSPASARPGPPSRPAAGPPSSIVCDNNSSDATPAIAAAAGARVVFEPVNQIGRARNAAAAAASGDWLRVRGRRFPSDRGALRRGRRGDRVRSLPGRRQHGADDRWHLARRCAWSLAGT